MTDDPKTNVVKLPDEAIEKCLSYADEVRAQYGSGDPLHAMPWTSNLITVAECKQWLASRIEAGLKIDIETCELGCWGANDFDPYGLRVALREVSEDLVQLGTNRFVRSPDSQGWVSEDDLPAEKGIAMYDRIERERLLREIDRIFSSGD